MKQTIFLTISLLVFTVCHSQLTIQNGSELYLQNGANIFVQGNIEGYASISGKGLVSLTGDSLRSINMNGFSVPNLTLDNPGNMELESNLNITESLNLLNGNLRCNNYHLELAESAVINRMGTFSGIETNGTGRVRKYINHDLTAFLIPFASAGGYTPLLLNTSGSYAAAYLEAGSKAAASPNKPLTSDDYLNNYWKVERTGIRGKVTAIAQYHIQTEVTGEETMLDGYFWNKTAWMKSETPLNPADNIIVTEVTGDGGEISAMKTIRGTERSSLAPNPAVDFTTLNIYAEQEGKSQMVIRDARGRSVRMQTLVLYKGFNQFNINIQSLSKGYYEVTVLQFNNRQSFRMIKQ